MIGDRLIVDSVVHPWNLAQQDQNPLAEPLLQAAYGSRALAVDELERGDLTVTLCLTDAACVHFHAVQAYISGVLLDLPQIERVTVVQTLGVLWTPDRTENRA